MFARAIRINHHVCSFNPDKSLDSTTWYYLARPQLASAEHGQRPKPSKHGAIAERGSEAPPAMTGVEDVGRCWKMLEDSLDWFKEKLYRNPDFMGNFMVSFRFSLRPVQWEMSFNEKMDDALGPTVIFGGGDL